VRVLTDPAQKLLADLPPYLQDSPEAQAVEQALGNELARVEDVARRLGSKMLPHAADDEFRTLGLWELLLGLSVEPPGIALADRQSLVLAAFRARHATSGAEWENLITTALGTGAWTYTENNDYSITLLLPRSSTAYTIGAVQALAQRVTPAHVRLVASFTDGFVVGKNANDPDASIVSEGLI
jgi:hypothetical protein